MRRPIRRAFFVLTERKNKTAPFGNGLGRNRDLDEGRVLGAA